MKNVIKIVLTVGILVVVALGLYLLPLLNKTKSRGNNVESKAPPTAVPTNEPSNKVVLPSDVTIAAWLWQSPSQIKGNIPTILEVCQKEGINTLYVDINEYIDIYEMISSSEKTQKLNDFKNILRDLATQASQKNISVSAVAGNTDWAYDTHNYIPPILLDFVYKFNQEMPPEAKLKGLQFDIEFYNDKNFFDDNVYYTDGFTTLVDNLIKQTSDLSQKTGENISLGFTVPYWFDKSNKFVPRPIIKDIYASLSKIPDSYIVIMAYSNKVDGEGGTIALAKNEMESNKDYSVKIIIGQDVTPNKDFNITHFGESKNQINEKFIQIIDQSKTYPNFQGISINDFQGYSATN